MLDALSGVDRAISTARRLAPPLLLAAGGALLLRMFRRSRPLARGGFAMKALFWVSMAKRALPFVTVARNLWRARTAARAAEASPAPDQTFDPTYR